MKYSQLQPGDLWVQVDKLHSTSFMVIEVICGKISVNILWTTVWSTVYPMGDFFTETSSVCEKLRNCKILRCGTIIFDENK